MAWARAATRRRPSSKLRAPAATRAENSPSEWPATISGLKSSTERLGEDDRVEEDGRLGDCGLTKVFVRTGKHKVCDAETENIIGALKELAGLGVVVVEVFAHADKLCSLTGKYVCFHCLTYIYLY